MERQLYLEIVQLLQRFGKRKRPTQTFSDTDILKVYFWSVIHDRSVSWSCSNNNWPIYDRRWGKPSPATMSMRLKSESVETLLLEVEFELLRAGHRELVWLLDGKPLPISGCSKDRQAGYGRAANCMAKGYKIHVICSSNGSIPAWRLAPMNVDERVIGERLIRSVKLQGYVVADGNFDSNRLHRACEQQGLQLIAPRRYGPGRGHGHRKQTASRLRSKEILESPFHEFGRQLLEQRQDIEHYFARLTNWGGGLTHLPPWVRTYRRVQRWVRAKLLLCAIRQRLKNKDLSHVA